MRAADTHTAGAMRRSDESEREALAEYGRPIELPPAHRCPPTILWLCSICAGRESAHRAHVIQMARKADAVDELAHTSARVAMVEL